MKDKIDLIFSDLKNEVITEKQAHQQVLDLFAVMQRSEQLVCDKCVDGLNKSKSFEKGTCVHCRKKV